MRESWLIVEWLSISMVKVDLLGWVYNGVGEDCVIGYKII